jgi:hypothetical protein
MIGFADYLNKIPGEYHLGILRFLKVVWCSDFGVQMVSIGSESWQDSKGSKDSIVKERKRISDCCRQGTKQMLNGHLFLRGI